MLGRDLDVVFSLSDDGDLVSSSSVFLFDHVVWPMAVRNQVALDDILEKSADYYDEEADSAVQRLVSLLEPVMIIFLGTVVGLLLAGVYPAIYESLGGLENM